MNPLKTILTTSWGNACLSALVRRLEAKEHASNVLRVLTYHRVDVPRDKEPYYPNLISATPDEFACQMDWVAEQRLFVSLEEVLSAFEGRTRLKPGAVLLTFDDANACFSRHAWPILRKRNLPVVMFVPTAYPDSPARFWWDRLYAAIYYTECRQWKDGSDRYELQTPVERRKAMNMLSARVKSLPHDEACQLIERACLALGEYDFPNNVLSWSQLSELAEQGVALAPHTRTHPLLDRLPLERARDEVVGAFRDLRERIPQSFKVFAYPSGNHNQCVVEMLRDEGFHAAFTVRRGINDLTRCDRFRLHRINVGRGTKLGLLRAQLLPQTYLLRPARS